MLGRPDKANSAQFTSRITSLLAGVRRLRLGRVLGISALKPLSVGVQCHDVPTLLLERILRRI